MSVSRKSYAKMTAAELRAAIRAGDVTAPTPGMAVGYAQTNLVILPERDAADFAEFCRRNPRPCPVLARTSPGDPCPHDVAPGADLRTDVPRYRVFRQGVLEAEEPTDVRSLWRDDFVGFLIGCSFSFEHDLEAAGLRVRHLQLGRNVPMYRTNRSCESAGKFAGPLVVSMRPYRPEQIDEVTRITGRYPTMHGPPLHVGDPAALGIADLARPDFGEAVPLEVGEEPLFWACGVTPQLALTAARPEICITHSPGCMFVLDRTDASYRSP
ncbi:MAG: putative hydro-lyase [Pirellulales bacterium]|nr:putative hydro-lyase [Pirellulales bacterium]